MKTKHLYYIWAVMFVLCAVLGFVRDARGASGWGYTAVSLAFFLPPAALLYRARRVGDSRTVRMLRCLSAASLGLSLLGLIVMKGASFTSLKLLLVMIFLWFSSPVSSHLIARLEVTTDEEPQKHYKKLTADDNGNMTVCCEREHADVAGDEKEEKDGTVF